MNSIIPRKLSLDVRRNLGVVAHGLGEFAEELLQLAVQDAIPYCLGDPEGDAAKTDDGAGINHLASVSGRAAVPCATDGAEFRVR